MTEEMENELYGQEHMEAHRKTKEEKKVIEDYLISYLQSNAISSKQAKKSTEIADVLSEQIGMEVTYHDIYVAKQNLCANGNPYFIVSNCKGYYIGMTYEDWRKGCRFLLAKYDKARETAINYVEFGKSRFPNREIPTDIDQAYLLIKFEDNEKELEATVSSI